MDKDWQGDAMSNLLTAFVSVVEMANLFAWIAVAILPVTFFVLLAFVRGEAK
jgi:hypothetical protein